MSARRYAQRGYRTVEGCMTRGAAELVMAVDACQKTHAVAGHVCEIGIHHGRSFLLLYLLRRAGELGLAVDLFDAQHENVDQSGRGDSEAFRANFARICGDTTGLRVLAANTLRLTAEDLMREVSGRLRLISVDGGHTREVTRHDLTIARGALEAGGVVILDDFFNEAWPGVAEGTWRFLDAGGELVPFASGANKLLFTTDPAHAAIYLENLLRSGLGRQSKTTEMCGHPLVWLDLRTESLRDALAATSLWDRWRATTLGRLAGAVLRRILRR